MYGQAVKGLTGVASTVTGISMLPNTGNNVFFIILSIFSIVAGVIILASFGVTKIVDVIFHN